MNNNNDGEGDNTQDDQDDQHPHPLLRATAHRVETGCVKRGWFGGVLVTGGGDKRWGGEGRASNNTTTPTPCKRMDGRMTMMGGWRGQWGFGWGGHGGGMVFTLG